MKREEAFMRVLLSPAYIVDFSLPIYLMGPSQMQCKQFLRFCFDLHFNKKINDKKLTRRLDELMSVLQIINLLRLPVVPKPSLRIGICFR